MARAAETDLKRSYNLKLTPAMRKIVDVGLAAYLLGINSRVGWAVPTLLGWKTVTEEIPKVKPEITVVLETVLRKEGDDAQNKT